MTRLAGVLLIAGFAFACVPKKPVKRSNEEDTSKAFAELDKNDKDTGFGEGGGASSEPEAPKGPVYPAPFTAEQIRGATKNGRTYRYKVEMPSKPTKEYAITFRNVDDGGAEVHSGGDQSKRMSWNALQKQSEFPKDKTQTRDEKLKTPAGKFECIVYEVTMEEGEVWTFYFAKKLPGAPVFFYSERYGKRLRTTTLVEHIPGK
ncbi:MAG: hypothetical protein KIT84_41245 [Labilithrix sp.]|nr:hypothetical protein [Labilithrix sp.]MCW5817497.1 hypothetical protein [Labilithrix sp.]